VVKKPVAAKPVAKPKAPVLFKVAAGVNKNLDLLLNIRLPKLASGGDLITWKSDLTSITSIEVCKEPGAKDPKWVVIHDTDEAKEAKIPECQRKALVFTALAYLVSSRTDRGVAYKLWVASNKKSLETALGSYTIRVTMGKSMVPILQFSVTQVLTLNVVDSQIVGTSLKIKPAQRRDTPKQRKTTTEDVSLIL
jgi:DNA primase